MLGAEIEQWALNRIRQRKSILFWPQKDRPGERQWLWWRRNLRRLFVCRGHVLKNTFGKATIDIWHQRIPTVLGYFTKNLYVLDSHRYQVYKQSFQKAIYSPTHITVSTTTAKAQPVKLHRDNDSQEIFPDNSNFDKYKKGPNLVTCERIC